MKTWKRWMSCLLAGCLLLAGREWGWGTSAVLFAAPAWLAGALARTRRGSVLAGMAAGLGVWAALGCRPLRWPRAVCWVWRACAGSWAAGTG